MPEKDGLAALKGDHRPRPRRARDHVLRARPGVQGARVDQGRRPRLRRQALPGLTASSKRSARRSPSSEPPGSPPGSPAFERVFVVQGGETQSVGRPDIRCNRSCSGGVGQIPHAPRNDGNRGPQRALRLRARPAVFSLRTPKGPPRATESGGRASRITWRRSVPCGLHERSLELNGRSPMAGRDWSGTDCHDGLRALSPAEASTLSGVSVCA